ncbi:uncharacterized protein Pyn_26883 [Prunus yedoensis var. nudiflora]|uniref:Uncharacterized protein n=1 Tax=Prunus yedoensis var. nudiflora TaxID=2094558 RepID=A0A314XEX8_PRUYE|nr:uncharacterized protein Pyn_26883 [Prunus yedoensis var. nudiflora]
MLSAKEQIACEDHLLDPFVENFVLEIKVHFGMQDIELMHMWYALDLAVLAVGVMERTMTSERKSFHQVAFDHLKDLQNHLEAVNDIPRKVVYSEYGFLLA